MEKVDKTKYVYKHERLLCVDSMLSNSNMLTDLLYYDRIIVPRLNTVQKMDGMRLIGDPKREIKEILADTGLLLLPTMLFPDQELQSYQNEINVNEEKAKKARENVPIYGVSRPERKRRNQEIVDIFHSFMAKEATISSRYISRKGFKATIRIEEKFMDDFFTEGSDALLNIFYSQLPIVDINDIPINDYVDFLIDEETIKKRNNLFSWQTELAHKIDSGILRIEDVPELIMENLDSYTKHFRLIKKEYKTKNIMTILNIPASIVAAITVIGIPSLISNFMEFSANKTAYQKDLMGITNKEFAYIADVNERFKKKPQKKKSWFQWKKK